MTVTLIILISGYAQCVDSIKGGAIELQPSLILRVLLIDSEVPSFQSITYVSPPDLAT